jgi:DNA-binding MarR family transcriptional regulator
MTANTSSPSFLRQTANGLSGQRLYLRDEELDAGLAMIFDASNAIRAASLSACAQNNVKWTQARALTTIARRSLGVQALSVGLGITKQAAIKTVEDLESRGFVHRVEDPNDGRRKTLVLTPVGEEIARSVAKSMRSIMATAYRQAGGDAVAGCDLVLSALIQAKLT